MRLHYQNQPQEQLEVSMIFRRWNRSHDIINLHHIMRNGRLQLIQAQSDLTNKSNNLLKKSTISLQIDSTRRQFYKKGNNSSNNNNKIDMCLQQPNNTIT